MAQPTSPHSSGRMGADEISTEPAATPVIPDQNLPHKKWKWPLISRLSEGSMRRFKDSTRETRKHWGSFCKSTSIHGLRYIAEPKKSHLDRIWWLTVVALGLLLAAYYVSRQWIKWDQTVIDANNADGSDHLSKLPFPAITICDNRKLNATLNESVSSENRNLLFLICGDDRLDSFNYTEEHLFNLIPPLIMNCTMETTALEVDEAWTSRCDDLIVRTLTDQGVCYTFNMFQPQEIFVDGVEHGHQVHGRRSEWDLYTGYEPGAKLRDTNFSNAKLTGTFPKRFDNGITLRLYHSNDTSPHYCYGGRDGYRIIVHSNFEFPMVGNRENPWVPLESQNKDKYLYLPAYKKSLLDVRSRFIYPADSMASYRPKQRMCYLPGEKPLTYFKKYSYSNCQLECLTNLTKEGCGCVDFYMPRKVLPGEPDNITNVCVGRDNVICAIHMFDLWNGGRQRCDCLSACTTIDYNIVSWYSNRPTDLPKPEGIYEGLLVTEIVVYTSEDEYIKSERRAMYTKVDFIADCGGVFGLFCGMSIISVVELLYYWFLWIIGRIDKSAERRKSMAMILQLPVNKEKH